MEDVEDNATMPFSENEEISPKKDGNLLNSWENLPISTKIPISEPVSFTTEVRKPLIRFMNITGLHEGWAIKFFWFRTA